MKFYGALGNHDSREQRYYKLFNMEGKFYYSFKAPKQDVRFIALDSTYPEPEQIEWAAKELKGAAEAWKIAYFHHPALLIGRTPWLRPSTAGNARADVPERERQRRVPGARPLL